MRSKAEEHQSFPGYVFLPSLGGRREEGGKEGLRLIGNGLITSKSKTAPSKCVQFTGIARASQS